MKQYPTEYPAMRPPHSCGRCGYPVRVKFTENGHAFYQVGWNIELTDCPRCRRKLAGGGVVAETPEAWGE